MNLCSGRGSYALMGSSLLAGLRRSRDSYRFGHHLRAVNRTIPQLFDASAAAVPDRIWLRHEDRSLTYAETRERAVSAAAGLRERGLGRGDVVLATMRNTPEHVVLWLGSAYAGTVLCTVNPASSEAELEGLAAQVEPGLVLADEDVATLAAEPTTKSTGILRGPRTRR